MQSTWLVGFAAAVALCGCAALPTEAPPDTAAAAPAQWHAPLPHGGAVGELARWWQQFDDPLIAQLVQASQAASPTIASAASRIAQARAARTSAGAALWPTLDASVSATRGRQELSLPTGTTASAGLETAWEIDVFGARRAALDAAGARLQGAQAGWHEARVSVAAEVAATYVSLRACEALLVNARADAGSREETARLTELSARAGFQSPANAALSRASAAQARSVLKAQQAQCDSLVKALVALTAIDEAALRERLAAGTAAVPQPAELAVAAVPAAVLAQRPDLYRAGLDVAAASADVRSAQAQRLPRITLAGSIGAARFDGGGVSTDGSVWRIGPVAVTLPLFDAGARRANVEAARAVYDESVALYRAGLRTAVREVEDALIDLQSTAARTDDAQIAVDGFEASFNATDARYRGGLASLFELEEARRSLLTARNTLVDLRRERTAAWIALYRALGGGWSAQSMPMPMQHAAR